MMNAPASLRRSTWMAGLALCALALGGVGCSAGEPEETFEARPGARRYPITGVVRAVNADDRTMTVAHDPIPDLMDAMTMDFVVRERWALQAAGPGDRISATLVLDGARSWIESVVVTKADIAGAGSVGATPGLSPGDRLPDLAFVDQDGRAVSTTSYSGHAAVYTFIYTRCPLPDYCPLMMQRLNDVAALLREQDRRDDVWLIAVTLDPTFDTPDVLRGYGERTLREVDGRSRFERAALLTGEPDAIRSLAAAFLLTYESAGDEIVHGLRTVVVDADGQVVRVFRGNDWTAEALVAAIP